MSILYIPVIFFCFLLYSVIFSAEILNWRHLFLRNIVGQKSLRLCVIFFFLLLPVALSAGGNPEKGLPKVDRLIKDKNYNEAILELATYMQENPDDFDGAQRRIRRIIDLRDMYNSKAIELLLVLASEPTNDQKKLEMITYMESLEKNPNQATRNFIMGTKEAAQFTYYRAKFDEIMLMGDAFIDKGQYVDAAQKFTEGYVFYKQEYDEEADSAVLSQVNSSLGQIMSAIGIFIELQISLDVAVAACVQAVNEADFVKAEAAYFVFQAELERLARLRNTIAEAGWFFSDSFTELQSGSELLTENSFLPFAYRFTLGRKTSTRFEGVLGAIDAQWNKALDTLQTASDSTIRGQWTAGNASLSTSSGAAEGIAYLDSAKRFASLGGKIASSASLFTTREDTFGKREYESIAQRYAGMDTLVSTFSLIAERYVSYDTLKKRIEGYSGEEPVADAIRKAPSTTVLAYSSLVSELDALIEDVSIDTSPLTALGGLALYQQELESFRDRFSRILVADRLSLVLASANFQDRAVARILSEWQARYAEGNTLLEGVSAPPPATTLYYPVESIVVFNGLRAGVTSDLKAVSAVLSDLRKVPEALLSNKTYALSVSNIAASAASLDSLYGTAGAAIARANSRILQANLARQESDLRYVQSQAALKKLDFQSARENLQRSRDKVNQSLALQESVPLRNESDSKLEKLGLEITRIENESVVREVRVLISSGKNFYYLGNFDQAEQILIQARTRWAVTNIEPNPEISNWLEIINTALSMKTGRTIPVSAPLYPQMSQILSSANQLYNEGSVLIAALKKAEALAVLTSAKEKLQQLQLVYPINQDAGQLTLRINQLIDPAVFTEFFKQKVEYVRANYKTERQTAYGDLLDLYEINPQYPGIEKLLNEVEIFLGIQIPPPDPKALARSLELTRSAQKIYDANTRSMFQVALNQLDEAIKLNSENQTAIALKDRVQTSGGGGQSVAVLSGIDEAKYQQAVQELQKGNKITASALVEQLLLNPKSKNSSKILDLKKRIDSQL